MSRIAFLVSVVIFFSHAVLGEEIDISVDGNNHSVVIVSEKATMPEKHAAEELVTFLSRVTGAHFEILSNYTGEKHRIFVGYDAAKQVDANFAIEGLGSEGIVIRSIGKDLILAGGRPRGTLYAVYTFLEDIVGCRWWTPTASYIPRKATLKIESLNIRYIPKIEYREPYWGGWVDGDWAVRNKHNGSRSGLDEKRGGKIADIGPCHSFYHYLSPEKYFAAHPEWFSEVDGKRVSNNAQLCLTNKEMQQEFIKNVKDDVRAHYPGGSWVWVAQEDYDGYCQCKQCSEVNAREESPAGTNIYFVNAVADAVSKEFPGVSVMTMAYTWSQKPPKYAKVSPNVIIELATTDCSYNRPYTHEVNRQFKERIEAWAKIADRLYIWDYLVNFANYICPHPDLRTLGPNVKFFADNHVKGIFGQGAWEHGANGTEMADLRRWVLCKLYWNPSLDGQKLIDEFLEGYYGPAGKHIRAYLDVFHDASEASGAKLGMMETAFSDNYLSFETMYKCLKHMDAAMAAVAADKEISGRVEVARMPVLYVFLMRWDEFQEKAKAAGIKWPLETDIKPVYDYFEAVRAKNGMESISEKNDRGQWPSVKTRVNRGPSLVPPGCERLPVSSWVDLQNTECVLINLVPSSSPQLPCAVLDVKDSNASDASAARLRSDCDGKALAWQLWRVPVVARATGDGKKLRCKISVKCEVIGKNGIAFKCGIDGKPNDLVVNVADISSSGYVTYDMGQYDNLATWIHLWVASSNNPKNVKAIWVDRAWLVME